MTAGVDSDPLDTNRKIVRRAVDYGVKDLGEVSIDFVADTHVIQLSQLIGTRRRLDLTSPSAGSVSGYSIGGNVAYLTSFSTQVQVGDYVRGSVTFKFSDSG